MTTIHHKQRIHISKKKHIQGYALLVFILILMLSLTILIISLSKAGIIQQKIAGNTYRSAQAFEAAQAGLEFGTAYLAQNKETIISDADSDGFIDNYSDANTSNVTLANGSKYTITYTNPTANNFSLIRISSTGTSADGSASREVRQQVYFFPLLYNYSSYPLYAHGNVSLSGSSSITNLEGDSSIITGGSVTFSGSATTILSGGASSSASQTLSDVDESNASLSGFDIDQFFMSVFGTSAASVKNVVTHYYSNTVNTNYSSDLDGMTNTSIWIDQLGGDATIGGNTTIGSITDPVILIVNGNLNLGGTARIYGFIYVTGDITSANTVTITGGMAIGGNTIDSGNISLIYNSSILSKLQEDFGRYAVVAGSWNDFQQ